MGKQKALIIENEEKLGVGKEEEGNVPAQRKKYYK